VKSDFTNVMFRTASIYFGWMVIVKEYLRNRTVGFQSCD